MDAEQFEKALRLQKIFMPEFMRRRQAAYVQQTGTEPQIGAVLRFAHYTSASVAMSIIAEKRIWMRNTNCMSDYSEIYHGHTELLKSFDIKNPDRQRFLDAIENCSPGAATQAIGLFDQWFHDTRFNTYITSISEHMASKDDVSEDLYGRLSMWRAFGGTSARVAIVFKIPSLLSGQKANKFNWLADAVLSDLVSSDESAVWIGIFSNIVTERTWSNV